MNHPIITRDPEECQYSRLRPDRFDEPGGYVCSLSRDWDGCGGEHGECPLIQQIKTGCPRCYNLYQPLLMDTEIFVFGCDECGSMFSADQVDTEWCAKTNRLDYRYHKDMVKRLAGQRQKKKRKEAA